MKLIHRLNLSFAALLLVVLAITAVLIYPLLFNVLVDRQRQEMQSQASMLVSHAVPTLPAEPVQAASEPPITGNEDIIAAQKVDAVLFASDEQVLYSNLPSVEAMRWIEIAKRPELDSGIWQAQETQYIVEIVSTPIRVGSAPTQDVTALMAVPVSDIQSLQLSLFLRLMVILFVGAVMAFLLSTLITKRLVTPLSSLQKELKKVETRRFSAVQLVQAGGEIGEVASSVYQLAGVLEQYQRTQKQFFQNVSHELKTPLASIQGYAEGIKDGVFTGAAADKGLDTIVEECVRLKKIVTEMILLAKLESKEGIFHMEKVAVQDLLAQTVERINPLLVKKELQVQLSEEGNEPAQQTELYINADREKLLQALINIVSNAARYAKQTIRFRTFASEGGISIEITDDGEGIPDDLLPQLFQRFAKGKNGETGLGLAISRAIVERCRGHITARNLPEGGASFVLHFPKPSF